MGVDFMEKVVDNPHFTSSENGVMFSLARHADNNTGVAFPSVRLIHEDSGLSLDVIWKHLRDLREAGLFTKQQRGRGNLYTLDLDAIQAYSPRRDQGQVRGGARRDHDQVPRRDLGQVPSSDHDQVPRRDHDHEAVSEALNESVNESSTSSPMSRKTKVVWEPPKWFVPMVGLEGYKKRDHGKACEVIRLYCEGAHVEPGIVVQNFAQEWPWLKVEFGRSDPVQMLRNTKHVQVSKMRGKQGQHGVNGRGDGAVPHEPAGQTGGTRSPWDNRG